MSFIDYTANVIRIVSLPSEMRSLTEMKNAVPWIRKKSKVFSAIDEDLIIDVIKNCKLGAYKENQLVIRQAMKGDTYFVLLSGRASVYVQDKEDLLPQIASLDDTYGGDLKQKQEKQSENTDEKDHNTARNAAAKAPAPNDKPQQQQQQQQKQVSLADKVTLLRKALGRHVFTYAPGASFGELALIQENAIRNASIITDVPCNFMVIDRALYNRSLKSHHEREMAQKVQAISNCYLFSSWTRKQRHMMVMSLIKDPVELNESIVKQGEPLKALYFLINGCAKSSCQPELHFEHFHSFFNRVIPQPSKFRYAEEYAQRQEEDSEIVQHYADASAEQSTRATFRAPKKIEVAFAQNGSCIGDFELSLGLQKFAFSFMAATRCEILILDLANIERFYNVNNRLSRQHINTTEQLLLNTEKRILKRFELVKSLQNFMLFRRALTYIKWQKALISRMKLRMQMPTSTHENDELLDVDLDALLKTTRKSTPKLSGRKSELGPGANRRSNAAWGATSPAYDTEGVTSRSLAEDSKAQPEARSYFVLRRLFANTKLSETGLPKMVLTQQNLVKQSKAPDLPKEQNLSDADSPRALAEQEVVRFRSRMPQGFDLETLTKLYDRFLRRERAIRRKSGAATPTSSSVLGRRSMLARLPSDSEQKTANVEDQIERFVQELQKMTKHAKHDTVREETYRSVQDGDGELQQSVRSTSKRWAEDRRGFPYKLSHPTYDSNNLPKPGGKVLLHASRCNSKNTISVQIESAEEKRTLEIRDPTITHDHVRAFVIPESIIPYLIPS